MQSQRTSKGLDFIVCPDASAMCPQRAPAAQESADKPCSPMSRFEKSLCTYILRGVRHAYLVARAVSAT